MVFIVPLNVLFRSHSDVVVLASPSSLGWLRKRFGISMLFLDCLIDMSWGAKPECVCYDQCDDSGSVVQTGLEKICKGARFFGR